MNGASVRREALGLEARSSTAALLTWAWDRAEGWSHHHCRCRATLQAPARVTVSFVPSVPLATLHLRFEEAKGPRALRVEVTQDDGAVVVWTLSDLGETASVALPEAPVAALSLVLQAGAGPASAPSLLALLALAAVWRAPSLALRPLREGRLPDLPFPGDAPAGCLLPLHRARGVELRPATPMPLGTLVLRVARLGAFGDRARVSAWARGLRALTPEGRHVVAWAVDDRSAGLVAGETHLLLRLQGVSDAALPWVRLEGNGIPEELSLLGARWSSEAEPGDYTLAVVEEAPQGAPSVGSDAPGSALRAAGRFTPAAARALLRAPPMAASLGLPGRAERVAVAPCGALLVPAEALVDGARSHGACLRLGWEVEGHEGAPRHRSPGEDGALTVLLPRARVAVTVALREALGVPRALLHFRAATPCVVSLAWTLRDGLGPVHGDASVHAWPAGWARGVAPGVHETRASLAVPADEAGALVEVPLGRGVSPSWVTEPSFSPGRALSEAAAAWRAARARVLGSGLSWRLSHAGLARVARGLLEQAALFFDAGGRVPYGRFPGSYDGDVFGLEEDWLFQALAQWGHGAAALGAFRATYLTASHLARDHYLHDLRNGLTPWQAARLARTIPDARRALTAEEREHLADCGRWVLEARRRPHAGRFPGLLPPSRYGGDLDFPTQSLTANAANIAGLYALEDLGGVAAARFGEEALALHRAWSEALDAVATTDSAGRSFLPMHTGGGDPGQYHALMVAGILEPLHLLGPEDPRLLALHAHLEESDALRLALPRFDGWGTGGRGIDAHYAVGYLLDQLHRGRRELFWTGLCGLLGSAMDPGTLGFREVSDALPPGSEPWLPELLPRRLLGQAEPCVGGVGVALQLLRAALVVEEPDAHGLPSRRLRVLAAPLPGVWNGDGFHLTDAPTAAGPVSLRVDNLLALRGEVTLTLSAPGAAGVRVHAPTPQGFAPIDGPAVSDLPPGEHTLRWRFAATDPPAVLPPGAPRGAPRGVGRVRAAIVPAAGLGTRLLPATLGVAKELLPLGRYPCIVSALLEIAHAGLADVVVTLSPGKDSLRRALDPDAWPEPAARDPSALALRALLERLRLTFVEQPTPDGALDAVARARARVTDAEYVVVYPDFVHLPSQRGLGEVLAAWEDARCTTFGMVTATAERSARFGPSASVEPEPEAILAPGEAAPLRRVSAPVGLLAPGELRTAFAVVQDARYDEALARAQRELAPGDAALLPALCALAAQGRVAGTLLSGELLDLGVLPGYLHAARRFAAGEAHFEDLL